MFSHTGFSGDTNRHEKYDEVYSNEDEQDQDKHNLTELAQHRKDIHTRQKLKTLKNRSLSHANLRALTKSVFDKKKSSQPTIIPKQTHFLTKPNIAEEINKQSLTPTMKYKLETFDKLNGMSTHRD